jgi:type I restriction enzyme S subunit
LVLKSEAQVLPDSWSYQSLGKCLKILTSGSRPKGGARQINEGIPSIGGEHINWDGTFKLDNIKYIPDEYFRSMKRGIIEKNDILLVKDGVTIGKLALAEKLPFKEAAVNEHVFLLKIKDDISKNYLFQYLISPPAQHQIRGVMSGSAQPGINSSIVDSVTVPVPPLVEQRGIAEVLGTIDEAIGRTDAVIEKAEELKRGLIQRLLTRGIGHTEFKQTELGEIPFNWKISSLKEVTQEHKQGYYTNKNYNSEGVKLIRITDLENPQINWNNMPKLQVDEKTYNQFKVDYNDFLFARSGAIGRYGIVKEGEKAIFGSYIIRFKFNQEKILNDYFGYLYQTSNTLNQIQGKKHGSTNININAEDIKSIKIILPNLEEQKRIVSILSKIDFKIKSEYNNKNLIINMKNGLMQILLSGKNRVELRENGLHRISDG